MNVEWVGAFNPSTRPSEAIYLTNKSGGFMSLMTLQLGLEHLQAEDRAIDQRASKRTATRKQELTAEEIAKQGEELYEIVVKKVKESPSAMARVSCKIRANSVFKYVVEKFESKGFKANHTYSDGGHSSNSYDYIQVHPNVTDLKKAL
jgi:hypothetical protein